MKLIRMFEYKLLFSTNRGGGGKGPNGIMKLVGLFMCAWAKYSHNVFRAPAAATAAMEMQTHANVDYKICRYLSLHFRLWLVYDGVECMVWVF